MEAWQSLVHVCRRWRNLVFVSPRRLNLHLFCKLKTPVKETLDAWPALALIFMGTMTPTSGMDNIIVALGQNNHLCQVIFRGLAVWQLEKVLATMQVPFLELTDPHLVTNDETLPVIPDSFWMDLSHVCDTSSCLAFHFRDYQNYYYLLLTLSTSLSLVFLIPGTFYPMRWSLFSSCCPASKNFSSDSNPLNLALTGKPDVRLIKTFYYPRSDFFFYLEGVIKYLEDLVTFIDAPQLDYCYINVFNSIDFDTLRLA